MQRSFASKSRVDDLAIFSGTPAFGGPLHVNRPNIGKRETFDRYVDAIWDSRWFTNHGPLAAELEQVLAEYLGVKHCILMSSGTAALAVLAKTLDLRGEVIMPSFTFVSTAHVLQWSGITPIFCDIDANSWNIDSSHCEKLINERTSAIIATHLWGRPCEIETLQKIADRHGIRLIFDAAHAFGCTYRQQPIGRFGDAEVFSFHANKAFHTVEGGAVTTNDDDLVDKLRAIQNFGFTGYDRVEYLGTNAKFSETSAAIGLTNFEMLPEFVELSKRNYSLYRDYLSDGNGVAMNLFDESERNNYHYISLQLTEHCRLARDEIIQILHAENVLARRYFFPGCHRMEPYRTLFPQAGAELHNTDRVAEKVLVLPGGASVTDEEVQRIGGLLSFIMQNAGSIRSRIVTMNTEAVSKQTGFRKSIPRSR